MRELRFYQNECVEAIISSWNRKQNEIPYASMMTGLGKSLVLAEITRQALNKGKRVLQLVPRLELCTQNYKTSFEHVSSPGELGIVCSQLGKNQLNRKAIVAMYSSFYGKRKRAGSFDVLLIDECHFCGNNENSQYRKIIAALLEINPKMLIAGVTASPYRLGQGMLHNPCIKGVNLFNTLVYDTSVHPGIPRLVEEGYLAHIEVKNTLYKADLSGVRMSGLDFNANDAGIKFDAICANACEEMQKGFIENDISTAIIFASTIKNAEHIINCWKNKEEIRIVHGKMDKKTRADTINWLKESSHKRYVVNINILSTGFDFPELEAVGLMAATTSPGLLVQRVGRLLRPHEGKVGMVWDFGSNFERLGSIDSIVPPKNKLEKAEKIPGKDCLECGTKNRLSAKKCSNCQAEFVLSEDGNYSMRTVAQALAIKKANYETYDIDEVLFNIHTKNGIDMIKMLFYNNNELLHTDYICLDHPGTACTIAKQKIISLFKNVNDFYKISHNVPGGHSVKNIMYLLENNYDEFFKKITRITVDTSGKFKKLISWEAE